MAEVAISKEKLDYTIDLLITMTVEEIAEDTGNDLKDVLCDFLSSKTGKALYDDSTKLWCNGPSYIAELYMEERHWGLTRAPSQGRFTEQAEILHEKRISIPFHRFCFRSYDGKEYSLAKGDCRCFIRPAQKKSQR